ncbi:uncharacterized protein LOC144551616 isoform X1 [Carex rostrata]
MVGPSPPPSFCLSLRSRERKSWVRTSLRLDKVTTYFTPGRTGIRRSSFLLAAIASIRRWQTTTVCTEMRCTTQQLSALRCCRTSQGTPPSLAQKLSSVPSAAILRLSSSRLLLEVKKE